MWSCRSLAAVRRPACLRTFPEAREITTISLEHAGDPRRLASLSPGELRKSLCALRSKVVGLLRFSDSKTSSLMKLQRGKLSGELSYFMIGLAVHGYEPVSVRYFRIEQDGSLHYLSRHEIDLLAKKRAARLRRGATAPDFSSAFSNVEIAFKRRGAGAGEPLRGHRHIAADLSNDGIGQNLLSFLERRGHVSAMTKAASYLLWRRAFSRIRDYLLEHMEVMVSDSTGVPPELATRAGFIQRTAGHFNGSFLPASATYNRQFRKLWKNQPYRRMNFRYGYLDSEKRSHMMITLRAKKK